MSNSEFIHETPFPTSINLEPTNNCNLKCPLCPSGTGKLKYKKGVMSFESYKIIIDKIPTLNELLLFNWGEPFLNPYIFDMVKYAKENQIKTTIDSNFSFKRNDKFFENIVLSGLDKLILSIDGASQESYKKYRIGGDFELVLSNIIKLVKVKERFNSLLPDIIWNFIINKYNEAEIIEAKKMAIDIGINFNTAKIGLSDDLPDLDFEECIEDRKRSWLPNNIKHIKDHYIGEHRYPLYKTKCIQLFKTTIINHNGKVFPCCWVTNEINSFGDILKESFYKIWNNDKYQHSRSLFNSSISTTNNIDTVCNYCNIFTKRRVS